MKSYKILFYKRFLIFLILVGIALSGAVYTILKGEKNLIESEKRFYINQAQNHFDSIVNMRQWIGDYEAVYVRPRTGQEPNPYLVNNILKVDENLTLFRMNSAWMTRQLSERAKIYGMSFHISSDRPLNPEIIPTPFDLEAIKSMNITKSSNFYRFEKEEFKFMGALFTTPRCLRCHSDYKIGEIRGGITIILDAENFLQKRVDIIRQSYSEIFALSFIAFLILLFYFFVFKNSQRVNYLNSSLEKKVDERTKEINRTKMLFEGVLNAERNLVFVFDSGDFYYVNQTTLDFFQTENMENFLELFDDAKELFSKMAFLDENIELSKGNEILSYLLLHQQKKYCVFSYNEESREYFFRPHLKEIDIDGKKLFMLTMNDITTSLVKLRELENSAMHDPLTGLANRLRFRQVIENKIDTCKKSDTPLCILFLDIDFFKKINDTYGHECGDKTLVSLSRILEEHIRKTDLVARWGGEEFIIILSNIDTEIAQKIAQNIRIAVEEFKFSEVGEVTVSIGVSCFDEADDVNSLVKKADALLYKAKESGRNRVCVDE
jgi:diguanylate cyclase (GGDEF)-like protein